MQRNTGNIFGGINLINAESVKARLKNHAKECGHTLQDTLTMYGLERTLYRISVSSHSDKFTLKGGILLYALFDGEFARATTDIDLLAKGTSNDIEAIENIFKEIFAIKGNDALRYDLNTLNVHLITEFKEYHGVKISIVAYLDRTKLNVSLDIGFGDVVYPDRTMMEFPVLLGMEAPNIYAYSIESIVAEKFEAFVQLGYANSRYKDFYDIYILATTHDFMGAVLKQAIMETFEHRKTGFVDIVAFEREFAEDRTRQIRWSAFVKKKKAMVNIEFELVLGLVKEFLVPLTESIKTGTDFQMKWSYEERKWD